MCYFRELYSREAVIQNYNNRDLNLGVDGSWQKRRHVSLNGIVSITSADTAKVLHIVAMSEYCQCPKIINKYHRDSLRPII